MPALLAQFLHFEPSLDASILRSDDINSTQILFHGQVLYALAINTTVTYLDLSGNALSTSSSHSGTTHSGTAETGGQTQVPHSHS